MHEITIPDKLYFRIGEVAKLIGVEPYVLRYWETEFPEISPVKSRTKQRLYKRQDVEVICKIRDLLYKQNFTIKGAKKKLKGDSTPEHVPAPQKITKKSQIKLGFAELEDAMPEKTAQILQSIIQEMDEYLDS